MFTTKTFKQVSSTVSFLKPVAILHRVSRWSVSLDTMARGVLNDPYEAPDPDPEPVPKIHWLLEAKGGYPDAADGQWPIKKVGQCL